MKTKLFSRALSLMLASLMLLSAIACGKIPDETGDTTTTTATTSTLFDMIHDSMALEFGYVYSNPLGSQPITVYTNILKTISSFSSAIRAQQKVIAKQYDKLVETINDKCEE